MHERKETNRITAPFVRYWRHLFTTTAWSMDGGGSFPAANASELARLKVPVYQSNRPTPDVKLLGITCSLRVLVVTIAGRQETTCRTVTLRPPPPVSLFHFFFLLCVFFFFLFERSVVVCVISNFETRSGHAHRRSQSGTLRE